MTRIGSGRSSPFGQTHFVRLSNRLRRLVRPWPPFQACRCTMRYPSKLDARFALEWPWRTNRRSSSEISFRRAFIWLSSNEPFSEGHRLSRVSPKPPPVRRTFAAIVSHRGQLGWSADVWCPNQDHPTSLKRTYRLRISRRYVLLGYLGLRKIVKPAY